MTDKERVQDLLKPRIIVENNYPRSPFKHHEIICDPSNEQIEWAKEFTQNFRFLSWHEEREVSDMPEYVKSIEGGYVYKIIWWDMERMFGIVDDKGGCSLKGWNDGYGYLPATYTEYNNYINSKQK